MFRQFAALLAMTSVIRIAGANDLKDLYELALTRDASLQAAAFQRDAAVEVRPQARSLWLPQVSAAASTSRERAGFDSTPTTGTSSADCGLGVAAGTQHCYG